MFGFLREYGLKRKYGEPVIVVSGLPRSGTSMMMRMLDAAGLPIVTDTARAADEDNPKGYFEDERVMSLDQAPDKSWLRDSRGKVVKVISFLLKDLPPENRYRVIFMRRDLDEVIASQNKMLVRRNERPGTADDDAKMIARYRMHLRKIEFALDEAENFDLLDIPYRSVLDDPRGHARQVARFLGRELDIDQMAAAVDRSLYRNRGKGEATVTA